MVVGIWWALLHRVGRGKKQGTCILLFKEGLSKNAVKRIKILKNSNDGFLIAEEDLKLRGFGDLTGYQQSGNKIFKFADPIIHSDLFELAEKYIFKIENNLNYEKYVFLLKSWVDCNDNLVQLYRSYILSKPEIIIRIIKNI